MSAEIKLAAGGVTLDLDGDLQWSDEFSWQAVEQSVERSVTGALIIYTGTRVGGRPITLQPPDDSAAWLPRAVLTQLQAWEAIASLTLTLTLRGVARTVVFRRSDGSPIEARPVTFVSNPQPGDIGDMYLVTLRLMEI